MATTLPRIHYTNKDYDSFFNQMLITKGQRLPEWTDTSDSDFGINLMQMQGLLVDVLSFYQDRAANEAFLARAQKRQSVIDHVGHLGYVMFGATASEGVVSITFPAFSFPASFTLPLDTTAPSKDDSRLLFEISPTVPVTVFASLSPQTVNVNFRQGVTIPSPTTLKQMFPVNGAAFDGAPGMVALIPDVPVIEGSVEVYVDEGSLDLWEQVVTFYDKTATDKVYRLSVDEDDVVSIIFGDSVKGKAPNGDVYIRYRIGGGEDGNIGPNVINALLANAGIPITPTVVDNPGAFTGGRAKETIEHAREAAPAQVRVNDRLVNVTDYNTLLPTTPWVQEVFAEEAYPRRVNVFVIPYPTIGSSIPGALLEYIDARRMAGVNVRVSGAIELQIELEASIDVRPNYKQSTVASEVSTAIANFFALSNADRYVHLNTPVPHSKVNEVLESAAGVRKVTITKFRLVGGPNPVEDEITPTAYQIVQLAPSFPALTFTGGQ